MAQDIKSIYFESLVCLGKRIIVSWDLMSWPSTEPAKKGTKQTHHACDLKIGISWAIPHASSSVRWREFVFMALLSCGFACCSFLFHFSAACCIFASSSSSSRKFQVERRFNYTQAQSINPTEISPQSAAECFTADLVYLCGESKQASHSASLPRRRHNKLQLIT